MFVEWLKYAHSRFAWPCIEHPFQSEDLFQNWTVIEQLIDENNERWIFFAPTGSVKHKINVILAENQGQRSVANISDIIVSNDPPLWQLNVGWIHDNPMQSFTSLESALQGKSRQSGPTCGLVAAVCAMFCLQLTNIPTVSDLLAIAIEKGYSYQGEMFSSFSLCHLLSPFVCAKVYNWTEPLQIIELLQSNCVILVPYDADQRHAPSLQNGRRAHWAVIHGFAVYKRNHIHVLARHGLSRYLAVWSLIELFKSCQQLKLPASRCWHDSNTTSQFRIGLLEKDLASQIIVLKA